VGNRLGQPGHGVLASFIPQYCARALTDPRQITRILPVLNAQRGVFEAGLPDGMWSVNQHSEDAQQGPLAGRNDCPDACRLITDGRRYAEAPLVATCLVAHFMNRVSVSDTRGSNFALDEGVPGPLPVEFEA
jgi:hypothetical protein